MISLAPEYWFPYDHQNTMLSGQALAIQLLNHLAAERGDKSFLLGEGASTQTLWAAHCPDMGGNYSPFHIPTKQSYSCSPPHLSC